MSTGDHIDFFLYRKRKIITDFFVNFVTTSYYKEQEKERTEKSELRVHETTCERNFRSTDKQVSVFLPRGEARGGVSSNWLMKWSWHSLLPRKNFSVRILSFVLSVRRSHLFLSLSLIVLKLYKSSVSLSLSRSFLDNAITRTIFLKNIGLEET